MLLGGLLLAQPSTAQEPEVDFERDVWPILERSCVGCHGAKEQYSNFRMDSRERLLRGGELGKVLVPGDAEASPLYARPALPAEDLDHMPVEGDSLSPEELETLRRWIADGADFGSWIAAGDG